MMLGNIISCAGQEHYDGKRKISEMIDAEIKETWKSMRSVMAKDDYDAESEEWMVTKLQKCATLRKWKDIFEEAYL